MTSTTAARIAAVAVLSLALAACGGAPAPGTQASTSPTSTPSSTSPAATTSSDAAGGASAPARSGFVSLAEYESDRESFAAGDVVLFFHAGWCPKCRETKENLESDQASLPPGLTVVEVDFDSEQDLRGRYGVTVQHTFVQIDAAGEQVAVWTGTYTGQDIAAKVA